MPRGDVEGLERVVIPLDLRALDRLEPKRGEDARHVAHRLGHRMQPTEADPPRRQGRVHMLAPELSRDGRRPKGAAPLLDRGLDAALRLVHGGAVGGLFRRGERTDPLRRLGECAVLPSEIAHARRLQGGLVHRGADLGDGPIRERPQFFAGHSISSREHDARRSSRDEGGPPRYHPCSLLLKGGRSVEALSRFTRAGIWPTGSGANSRGVGATGFHQRRSLSCAAYRGTALLLRRISSTA